MSFRRRTLPIKLAVMAIAVAALWLLARDPDALMLVQPSDHVIADPEAFHRAVDTWRSTTMRRL